jgi:hypothetical protein
MTDATMSLPIRRDAAGLRLTGFNPRRTFGVELEIVAPSGSRRQGSLRERIAREFAARDIPLRDAGYTHRVSRSWKLVSDGSVVGSNGARGVELVSPILKGFEGLENVKKVCEALAAAGAGVNRTCGFHVHHEAKDLTVRDVNVLSRLVDRFEPVLDGLLPPSRRRGGSANYCRPFTPEERAALEKAPRKSCGLTGYAARGEGHQSSASCRLKASDRNAPACAACSVQRYRNVNLRCLHTYGTVEFRQHSGTFEFEKVEAWVVLTQGLVEKAKDGRGRKARKMKGSGDGLDNLLRAAGLRSCKPHGHVIAEENKALVRRTSKFLHERAKHWGVLDLGDRSARRVRARRVQQTAAERVASVVAAQDAQSS